MAGTDVMASPIYEEKLYPCNLPGGFYSYRKLLLSAYLLRIFGLGLIVFLVSFLSFQFTGNGFGAVSILCDCIIIFVIVLCFAYSESVYINGGLSSRPLRIFENGLVIPPLYFRKLKKNGGFIDRTKVDHIVVRRVRSFAIWASMKESEMVAYKWRNAPVEFVVHLKNGRTRRSGRKPPETIREAVLAMQSDWNIKVIEQGSGNGTFYKFVNKKLVETIEL